MRTSSVYRLAGLELHEEHRRLLRDGGEEVVLQKRIFDLLAYLVRHRERVVSKDELIEKVWEGAFIADGAVQRAVSLLRTTLRDCGVENAVRTYPRQGYRFCGDIELGDEPPATAFAVTSRLEAAGSAFEGGDWPTAAEAFAAADRDGGLAARDLEMWGEAEENLGRPREARTPLERAVAAYAAAGDPRGAARAALRLANLYAEGRELAVAQGWLLRATRWLKDEGECREHGLAEWLAARIALFSGEVENSLRRAERVHQIGIRLGDPDLEALGLLYRGFCHVALCEVERGAALLDESGAAVLSAGVSPWVGGVVYCGIIYACLNLGDYRRAGEWNEQFERWCRTHTLSGYSGVCRLHQAEVLTLQGELARAERELVELCERLVASAPWAEGDAYRVLGEVRLARGDLEGAEAAFRQAHQLGWDPHPGYALLQLARGRREAAVRGLERALQGSDWPSRQRRGLLLAHLVMVASTIGDTERARTALAEIDRHSELAATATGSASVARARGELALAEGRTSEALSHFRQAVQHWREVPSPCNAAAVRLRLAQALAGEGDLDGAELELSAAEAAFTKACLPRLLEDCRALRGRLAAAARS